MKIASLFFLLMIITLGCGKIQPKAIVYGNAECAHCSMMVTDKKFGAELVTDKGRYYFFDSAECMLESLKENSSVTYAHILVTHINNPDVLADATSSFYVISKEIPSPMGAFLSAYATLDEAKEVAAKHSGEVFSFAQLQEKYSVNALISQPE